MIALLLSEDTVRTNSELLQSSCWTAVYMVSVLDAVKEDVSDLQVCFVPSCRRFEALGMHS